ncbi:hypothetical protein CLOM_g8212 [Closterium sp. NIES-68]|nr:hypothetical protein CLOM_g8212 [Closterium sp. NIES-68]GJP66121.1 hypothetical protein CLOP_g23034 [Closterium sp. NIES-67]
MAGSMQLRCKSMNDLTAIDFSGSKFPSNLSETRDSSAATPRLSVKRSRGRQSGGIIVEITGTPLNTGVSVVVCPGAPIKSKGAFKTYGASRKPVSSGLVRRLNFSLEASDSATSMPTGNSNSSSS